MRPSAAARSTPSVSRPAVAGTVGQEPANQSRPPSRVTRPGSTPGARPMSRAPLTFERRRAGRKRASGRAVTTAPAASTSPAALSASEARPSTTVSGPDERAIRARAALTDAAATPAMSLSVSAVATRARTSSPASPGRGCSEALASGLSPVLRGETSTRVTPSFTAA